MTIKRALTAVGVLTAACVLSAAAGTAVAGSAAFTDPAGDAGVAADITAVAINDNAATGLVTVTVTAGGYASAITDNSGRTVQVYLDTDRNPATGSLDQGGTEYCLQADRDAGNYGWWFERWDGAKYVDVPSTPGMNFARSGDTLTWTFSKTDIGGATGFNFSAWSAVFDANDTLVAEDNAPDAGTWTYALSATAPPPPATTTVPLTPVPSPAPATPTPAFKPLVGAPATIPAKPVAGARFTVAFPVTRSDTRAPLTAGKMVCDPSVNGKVITHAESFKGGQAKLSFVIPKSAKGQTLKVKVTINVGTQSTTRIATFHIG